MRAAYERPHQRGVRPRAADARAVDAPFDAAARAGRSKRERLELAAQRRIEQIDRARRRADDRESVGPRAPRAGSRRGCHVVAGRLPVRIMSFDVTPKTIKPGEKVTLTWAAW